MRSLRALIQLHLQGAVVELAENIAGFHRASFVFRDGDDDAIAFCGEINLMFDGEDAENIARLIRFGGRQRSGGRERG